MIRVTMVVVRNKTKWVQLFKEPVTSFRFGLCLLNSVHFILRNEAQNETNGTKEPASDL